MKRILNFIVNKIEINKDSKQKSRQANFIKKKKKCQWWIMQKKIRFYLIHVANTALVKIFPLNTNRSVANRLVFMSSRG